MSPWNVHRYFNFNFYLFFLVGGASRYGAPEFRLPPILKYLPPPLYETETGEGGGGGGGEQVEGCCHGKFALLIR